MDYIILKSDTERVPLLNHYDHRSVLVITVLVAGAVGDYAAYRAAFISDAYTTQHDQWAAGNGDKLSFAAAVSYFPFIEDEKYRR